MGALAFEIQTSSLSAADWATPSGEPDVAAAERSHYDLSEDEEGPAERRHRTVEASAGFGYRSNLFEVNSDDIKPIGDWFAYGALDLATPFGSSLRGFSLSFESSWKTFVRHSEATEYLLKPHLNWSGLLPDTGLSVELFSARFQEPIFFEFARVFNQSQTGWLQGIEWSSNTKLTDALHLAIEGTSEFRRYDSVRQDNLQDSLELLLKYHARESLTLAAGAEVHDRHYRHRPPDDEEAGNPERLDVLEARGIGRIKAGLGKHWSVESELSIGQDRDFTNGYYDALALGVSAGIRYEGKRWELKLVAAPEVAAFGHRPANFGIPSHRLTSHEYSFEFGGEYRLTKHAALFYSDTLRMVTSNSDERRSDPALTSFNDNSVITGLRISF